MITIISSLQLRYSISIDSLTSNSVTNVKDIQFEVGGKLIDLIGYAREAVGKVNVLSVTGTDQDRQKYTTLLKDLGVNYNLEFKKDKVSNLSFILTDSSGANYDLEYNAALEVSPSFIDNNSNLLRNLSHLILSGCCGKAAIERSLVLTKKLSPQAKLIVYGADKNNPLSSKILSQINALVTYENDIQSLLGYTTGSLDSDISRLHHLGIDVIIRRAVGLSQYKNMPIGYVRTDYNDDNFLKVI